MSGPVTSASLRGDQRRRPQSPDLNMKPLTSDIFHVLMLLNKGCWVRQGIVGIHPEHLVEDAIDICLQHCQQGDSRRGGTEPCSHIGDDVHLFSCVLLDLPSWLVSTFLVNVNLAACWTRRRLKEEETGVSVSAARKHNSLPEYLFCFWL